jgi:cholesterol transport system auxiliary component
MAYTAQPYQIAYFVKSRWADTPAQMLQSLLTQALQDTHYFYMVGASPASGYYDYVLNTQLLQFEQTFSGHGSEFYITLRAQLIKTASNQVIATRQWTVIEAAPENTPYGGVIAANRATVKMLERVAAFCSLVTDPSSVRLM